MATAVFDTLKASDTLKAVGIEARQAEAIVHTVAGAFEDTVATKADLVEIKAELKQEIGSSRADIIEVRAELKQEIASTRADIIEVRAELKQEIASTRAELKQEIASTKSELQQEIASTKAELKQEIASSRADIATVKGDIRLLKWMLGVILACVVYPILKSFLS